jgi:hypothetical protein
MGVLVRLTGLLLARLPRQVYLELIGGLRKVIGSIILVECGLVLLAGWRLGSFLGQ